MQRSDFTMSDFYASWQQAEIILEKLIKKNCGVELATLLLENMRQRKHKLLDNPAMLCCILLDPRFCRDLGLEQKKVAIDTILKLWRKMKAFNEKTSSHDDRIPSDESSDEDISIASTTLLKQYQKQNNAQKKSTSDPYSANVFQIADEIETFIAHDHEISDGNIFDFWKQNISKFPSLFQLAEVVFAISPTQAIVERAFSALSHIFSSKRNNLKGNLLEDILLISLNKELLYMVNEEEIAAINMMT